MADILKPKVLVVGGGPGGYVAAERCGHLGLDTILVDADRLGGTCLIRGCIPSKALIHAASLHAEMRHAAAEPRFGITLPAAPVLDLAETVRWKGGVVDRLNAGVAGLLKRARVRVLNGHACFSDARRCTVATPDGPVIVEAEHVILATGSVPVALPGLPFGGKVVSSTEALSPDRLPERLVVVGAGYIGLELGIAYRKLGTEVTIVEMAEQILPLYDSALVEPVKRSLSRLGIDVLLGARATGESDDGLIVETATAERRILPADRILVTIGRRPAVDGWGLDEMALARNGPFIKVDDHCRTSSRNVYAIGDVVGEPMLAHKASAQGEMVARIIAGERRRWDPVAIPAVCFTDPEIVSVGAAPKDVPADIAAITTSFPLKANGRALTLGGDSDGFVRVVARKRDRRILGIQAVGAHVSELVHQFTTLLEMGAVLEDVAGIIHAHPTLGEALHEASMTAIDKLTGERAA